VHRAPGIPHALILLRGGKYLNRSDALRREAAEVRPRDFRGPHPCLRVWTCGGALPSLRWLLWNAACLRGAPSALAARLPP